MIIWINGAFGCGKTTVSNLLNQTIKNSKIYDPEIVGEALSKLIPITIQLTDFQDYPEWREWNKSLLSKISSDFEGTLIVPMTIYKKEYYDEIILTLITEGIDVKHFLLEVSKEEIVNRLRNRNDGTFEWGKSKIDDILESCNEIDFTAIISNDQENPKKAANDILTILGYVENSD
nr:AAA family ATPase [Carnobacterium maltaromaticum]